MNMALSVIFFCLLCAHSGDAAKQQAPATIEQPFASILYTAVVKGKVALPCDITPPSMDDAVALILWYKDDSPAPIYTMDARRGTVEQARQSASSRLEARAYFNMINRPAFLQLDPVQEEDAGDYRCRVDFHKARTVNTVISLKVIVPPGEPVIRDAQGRVLRGTVGPYNEGEPLKLSCEAEGGKPRPAVTWWKEYTLIDDSYVFVSGDTSVRNDLEIPEMKRGDLLSVLTCQASNNNITVPASASVTLDLNLKPVSVQIQPEQRALSAAKPAKLTCVASGSRPPAVISWWKGSKELTGASAAEPTGDVARSVLSFTPSLEDNGSFFSCRAQNPVIPSSALEEGWKLEVHYPPQVNLQLGRSLQTRDIQEGNDVYLECSVRANPRVTEVTWFLEGRELRPNTSAGLIVSNQSLVLQRVQRRSRGRYSCVARNAEGQGRSNEILLNIKFAPTCKPGIKTVYGVGRHEAASVYCEVEADPADVAFHWRFQSAGLSTALPSAETPVDGAALELATFTADGLHSTATFTPHTDQDFGSLACWAENDVGRQREPCIFSLVPAGPPESPGNCTIQNETESSLAVDCEPGYDGGLSQTFLLEVAYSGEPRLNLTSRGVSSFLVTGLPPGVRFTLTLRSTNSKGSSPPTVLHASTLRPAEPLTGMQGMILIRPVLGLLAGILAALVVLSLSIVAWMKVKRKAKRLTCQAEEISTDKCNTPLKKDTDDLPEGEEKGPDIIPANIINRAYYTEESKDSGGSPSGSTLASSRQWTGSPRSEMVDGLLGGIAYRKPEDITYVELQIPRDPTTLLGLRRKDPVQIGAPLALDQSQRHLSEEEEDLGACPTSGSTCETPLMNNRRESAV